MRKIKLKTLCKLKKGYFLIKPKSARIKRVPWAKNFLYKILDEKTNEGVAMCLCYNNKLVEKTTNDGWNYRDFEFYRLTEREAKDFLLLEAL